MPISVISLQYAKQNACNYEQYLDFQHKTTDITATITIT
jgi:hypothetical protein